MKFDILIEICALFLLLLQLGNYADRIGSGASVFLAAVIEYLVAEITELAGNACAENKRSRIIPRHIMLAVTNDVELNALFKDVIISTGGVMPHIEAVLLPKKSSKHSAEPKESQEY